MADPAIRRLEQLMNETNIFGDPPPGADPADPSGWGVGVHGDMIQTQSGDWVHPRLLHSSNTVSVEPTDLQSSSPVSYDSEQYEPIHIGPEADNALAPFIAVAPPPGQPVLYGRWTRGLICPPDPQATFCPWRLVMKYADLYVGKSRAPLVKEYFEQEYLLENQKWDFFYLYNTADQSGKPFLLVPTGQVLQHLQQVNQILDTNLTIPPGREGYKFHIGFEAADGHICSIRPRYLGQPELEDLPPVEAFNSLTKNIPPRHSYDNAHELAGLEHRLFQDLWRLMKETVQDRSMKKYGRKKKTTDKDIMRAAMHKGWGHATKRVQRYMGLRKKVSETGEYTVKTDQQPQLSNLNLGALVPFWPEDSVVFICVDCEAYEEDNTVVTEVGVAILDARDLKTRAPGTDGKNWFELIKARHLRIRERSFLINSKYIQGCPDKFDFGPSEFVRLANVRKVLKEIFAQTSERDGLEKRPVVLVGHDIQNDIKYLARIGVWIQDMDNIKEIIDNQGLQQFMRRQPNAQGLERILGDLGIPFSHLHNAGNDAVYTLQSLIVLAIRQRQASLKRSLEPKADTDIVKQQDEGWSSGGEGCDGGHAPPPPRSDPDRVRNTVVVTTDNLDSDGNGENDSTGVVTTSSHHSR